MTRLRQQQQRVGANMQHLQTHYIHDRISEDESLHLHQETMRDRIERVTADLKDLKQFYNIEFSPTRYSRLREYYKAELEALETVIFELYDQHSKVDYLLLHNFLQRCLRQLDLDREKDKAMQELLPFADILIRLCEARQKVEAVNGQRAAQNMRDVVDEASSIKEEIRKGSLSSDRVTREAAYRASRVIRRLRELLQEWYSFYEGYDPLFTWWVKADYDEASRVLEELASTVSEELVGIKPGSKGAIVGEPIGREGLLANLEAEMICYTPEELISIAESEERWCVGELEKASQELGFGENWHDALEHVKKDYIAPGEQPQLAAKLVAEGVAFVKDNDLVTVPPLVDETWRMFMLSPEAQKVSPFFLGGDSLLVAYPKSAMNYESKLMTMRGNNRHFSRATVFHEMIPGHRLQFYTLERYRPYRKIFSTPFWMEGFAMQWEYVLWDKNFFKSPEDRIGTLFWRMHRCARILFSLKFHLGKWTPQHCIDYLVSHVGHERSTAEGEVRRSFSGDWSPLYQCGYMLGALQFYALRREFIDSGKVQEKKFYDFILHQNMMPIEMLRALLSNQRLGREFTSSWKFYEKIR